MIRRATTLIFVILFQLLNPANAQTETGTGSAVGSVPAAATVPATATVPAVVPSGPAARPKVALVLSGGSAYGLAHIGVIKVLEELGVPVDMVVGTSMGAIIGGIYAMGYNAAELDSLARATDWTDLFTEDTVSDTESFMYMTDRSRYAAALHFDKKGFTVVTGYLTGHKMIRFIDSISLSVPRNVDFDDLPRKFRSVATDISNGECVVFSQGSMAETMRASSSIPGVFAPYFLEGRYLVDGGLVDNLPVDLARKMGADIIIAVDLVNRAPFDPVNDNRSPLSSLNRTFDILVHSNVQRQLSGADLVISVDMTGFTTADFMKTRELMDTGERYARTYAKDISAIGEQEKKYPGYDDAISKHVPDSPPVQKIRVEGATKKRSDQITKLFKPLVGTIPDIKTIQALFKKIDKAGNKETIRIWRDFAQAGRPLVISLTKKKPDQNILRVNFSYEASFSNVLVSNLDLVPALSYPGLTTKDSRLLVDVELLDAPSFDIRFIQPLNDRLYVSPYFSYIQEFNTQITSRTVANQFRTVSQTAGVRFVTQPAYGLEFTLGWSYDWIGDLTFQELTGGTSVTRLSVLHANVDINRVDSQIFPMNGILASADVLVSRPELGSTRSFATIKTRGSAFLSLNSPLSVALLWKAGMVFDTKLDEADTIPAFYEPDLSGRRMFPGPLSIDERIGNHVAGLGIEIKYKLNDKSTGITFPIFILFHAAAGFVLPDLNDYRSISNLYHWNTTLGAGIKITDAFGVALRGGLLQRTDKSFIPFIALDIGSIAYK